MKYLIAMSCKKNSCVKSAQISYLVRVLTMTPFDFSNAILTTKEDLLKTNDDKEYIPYLINRALSYHSDAIYHANQMNQCHQLPKHMQFYYFLNSIKGKKRQFSKWSKPEDAENIQLIKDVYGYSNEKAKIALKLLTIEQLDIIKTTRIKGGTK